MKIAVFYFLSVLSMSVSESVLAPRHGFRVVCYLASWAVYLPGKGKFDIEDSKNIYHCTHVVYLFAILDENFEVKLEDESRRLAVQRTVELKNKYPHLRIMIGVGGWNDGSEKYSRMARSRETRQTFIQSASKFVMENKLDGMDLNWQFPGERGGTSNDRKWFVQLLKELRQEFDKHGLIISAAVSALPERIIKGVDAKELSTHANFLNILSYEYHGYWDGKVGPSAPLQAEDQRSVANTVQRYLYAGASPYKLNLGISGYGTTFTLADPNHKFIASTLNGTAPKPIFSDITGTAVTNSGWHGPYNQVDGFIAYNEICEYKMDGTWTNAWDEASQTPYLFKGDKVISYDDFESISLKLKLALQNKLGGVIFYGLEKDDRTLDCVQGKPAMPYNLLSAIDTALRKYSNLAYKDLYISLREYSADHFWNVCLGSVSECAART